MPFGYIGQNQTKQQVKNSGVLSSFDISLLEKNGQASGSLEFIETQTISSGSTMAFTSIKQNVYDVHYVQLISMETTSTGHPQGSKMQLRFSNDGGSSYESGASDYAWGNQYVATGGGNGESKDAGDSSIEWTPRCNNGEPTSAYMYLYNLGNSSKMSFTTSHTTINVDQGEFFYGGGLYEIAETINAIRFYNAYAMTGTIKLYGVKQIWVT